MNPSSQKMNRITIMAHSRPAMLYFPPPPVCVDVLELVVEPDVVLVPLDVAVVDQGCHTKTAMRIATRTITTMPIAAAPFPLPPSFTTTGPSAIECVAPFKFGFAVGQLYPEAAWPNAVPPDGRR
jgi:hypothetical protein